MYVGTKYEEERRIQEKRKKEGSRCRGRCYLSRQISTLFFGSAKVETSKSCLPQAGSLFPTFVCTSGLCVICNYVLHTLEYCTSSTRRILCFVLSHFQKTELKFGGINSNGLTNELSSSFLFSRILLSSSYLVPTYIRYLRRKTVVRNENRPIRGGPE